MLTSEHYKIAGRIAAPEFQMNAVRFSLMDEDDRRAEWDEILDLALAAVRRQAGAPEIDPSPSAEVIREEALRSGVSWDEWR